MLDIPPSAGAPRATGCQGKTSLFVKFFLRGRRLSLFVRCDLLTGS